MNPLTPAFHPSTLFPATHTLDWEALKNNGWLQFVMDRMPEAIVLSDDNNLIAFCNKSFCGFFFPDRKPQDLVGTSVFDILQELDFPFGADEMPASTADYQEGEPFVWNTSDGRVFLHRFTPFFHPETGIYNGHMCVLADETETTHERQQHENERLFFETILGSIPGDLVVVDAAGKYQFISPLSIKDKAMREWMIGRNNFDYCLARGKDLAIAQERQDMIDEVIRRRNPVEWEEVLTSKTGEPEYHRRIMYPVFDHKGDIASVVGWGMNVTESKIIHERVAKSEKRFKDLFNYSQAIIATHDLQGRFIDVNPALTETTGYTAEEVRGKVIGSFMHPNDAPMFEELYLNAIIHNKRMKGLLRIMHKTGRKIYLLYQNYLLESPGEQPYIITFAQDVTERIKAEKELKEAKKITEDTSRMKERFLANMSHEIRTPMNGIIGVVNLLRKTELNSEQSEYLKIIHDSAQNLTTIINDILDLEKIGSGKIVFESIPFNLIEKLSNTVSLFAVTAIQKMVNVSIVNNIGKSMMVKGDPTRLSQIMNNLLSNAVKFTNQGSITITADQVFEDDRSYKFRFAVADTGIGIDENEQIAIFQPFKQAYANMTRQYGGTGLGLAITKNLVELQHGEIWVQSQPGKGSTFFFTIVLEKAREAKPVISRPQRVENRLGRKKILFAEDNAVNQMLTNRVLLGLGFEAVLATDGEEAVRLFQTGHFDAILMDIQMPVMNGIEAAEAIRSLEQEKSLSRTPIIALTANALKGEEQAYYAAGIDDYLTKPFNEHDLYEKLELHLLKP